MTDQAPGFYRRKVGNRIVTVLNDGYLDAPLGVMPNIPEAEASAMLEARFAGPTPRLVVHGFLIEGGGQTILVDTGAGGLMGPSCGRLPANLAAAGVSPAAIDLVLLTHFHGDHFGGLTKPDGTAAFPNAELAYPKADADYWFDDAAMAAAPEERRGAFLGARASVVPYKTRMRPIEGGSAAPGISLVALPGHTPGHSGYRLEDGSDALLIWGDIIHVPAIQAARPEVFVGFDSDPELAVQTRRRMLDMAASERLAVAGMHMAYPGFFHVARAGSAYEIVTEAWVPVV